MVIYWTFLQYRKWPVFIACTDWGLCRLDLHSSVDDSLRQIKQKFSGCTVTESRKKLQPYIKEVKQYLDGERTGFTVPLHLTGTAFQKAVWRELFRIPYGRVCSYSQLALQMKRPEAVRAVAAAIGKNPVLIVIPCHRVIGKNGKLTGYRGGLETKKKLLLLEKAEIGSSP